MTAITHTFRFSGAGEDFGPRADGIVTLHTAESIPTRLRVADALIIARWQDRPDVAGSYNRFCCIDGVLSTVPDNHASGGINPSSAAFSPEQWLYEVLDRDQVRNPNYFTLNLCAPGQTAYFNRYGWPSQIIDGFARSWIDDEDRTGRRLVLTNHGDFQTNRTDAGPIAAMLTKRRYAELRPLPDTSAEVEMDFGNALHQIPKVVRIKGGSPLYENSTGDALHWTVPEGVGFDADLLLALDGRFLCRREGSGPAFFIAGDAIDDSYPRRLYMLDRPAPVVQGLTEAEAQARVESALASLNARIDSAQRG